MPPSLKGARVRWVPEDKINKETTTMQNEPAPTFETLLSRARINALLRLLSEPVILCSSCLLPCAVCAEGCSDHIADAASAA